MFKAILLNSSKKLKPQHFAVALIFLKKDLTYLVLIVIIIKSLGEVAELVEGAALEML